LLASIAKSITTAERGQWNIRLYVAVDEDDTWWLQQRFQEIQPPVFMEVIWGVFTKIGHRIPFSEMAHVAYKEGAEYFCRVNDDSQFQTSGWITQAVHVLQTAMDPPNLGVVGPTCTQGKRTILTHDFVHRTHLDIFHGIYYPLAFENWYMDDWITHLYSERVLGISSRVQVLKQWKMKHWVFPNRYIPSYPSAQWLPIEYERGRQRILYHLQTQYPNHPDNKNMLALSSTIQRNSHHHHNPIPDTSSLDRTVVEYVQRHIPENGNFLIWGMDSHTSPFWHRWSAGRVTFLDQRPIVYKLLQEFPYLDAYGLVYPPWNTSQIRDSCDYEIPRFPPHIRETQWDLILIPSVTTVHGWDRKFRNLYMSRQLANNHTRILVMEEESDAEMTDQVLRQVMGPAQTVHPLAGPRSTAANRHRLVQYPVTPILQPCDPPPLARDVQFYPDHAPLRPKSFLNAILHALPEDGNLLIWHVDDGSDFWHHTTRGCVAFLEDPHATSPIPHDNRTRVQYYQEKFPELEIHAVKNMNPDTIHSNSLPFLDGRPDRWMSTSMNDGNNLPELLFNTRWDVILVNGIDGELIDTGSVRPLLASRLVAQYSMKIHNSSLLHMFVNNYQNHNTRIMSQQIFDKQPDQVEKVKTKKNDLMLARFQFAKNDFSMQWSDGMLPGKHKLPLSSHSSNFNIIVLTTSRVESLKRLLNSIDNADYGDDTVNLIIKIDVTTDRNSVDAAVRDLAERFEFHHGSKRVEIAETQMGLRGAWLDAWKPVDFTSRAIILEDDLELSPVWYKYVKQAWAAYGAHMSIGGLSLNRQSLIPDKRAPSLEGEIVNDHQPFLYKLVGSQGFSPNPWAWSKFLNFVETIPNLDTFDADVPWLITSDWYKKLDKRHMWTQLFIYFCEKYDLYNLYVNLPKNKTLAAHWREKGQHFQETMGRDYELAKELSVDFPAKPTLYGWNGVSHGIFEPNSVIGATSSILTRGGSANGGWMYDPTHLDEISIVYSVGLSRGTSWDEAVMQNHNLQVWAFDPKPQTVQYVQSRKNLQTPRFHFTPEGLSTSHGVTTFTPPTDLTPVIDPRRNMEITVNTLENWMKANGHSHLDVLKMDMDGFEYNVLEDWVARNFFPMDQLLVEWHHAVYLQDERRHFRLLHGLKARGWSIAYSSPTGHVMTFLREQKLPKEPFHEKPNSQEEIERAAISSFDSEFVEMARRIANDHGFIMIQFVNRDGLEMTKSWICNVQKFPGVLDKVLFLILTDDDDEVFKNELASFHSSLHIVQVSLPETMMSSGQRPDICFLSVLVLRTRLWILLLEHGISVFWMESSDSVWLEDPTNVVVSTRGNVVGMSDPTFPSHHTDLLYDGFQFLRPTLPTIRVCTKMLRHLQRVLEKAFAREQEQPQDEVEEEEEEEKETHSTVDHKNADAMTTRHHRSIAMLWDALLRREPGLKVGWLPREYFVSGLYYDRDVQSAVAVVATPNPNPPKVIILNHHHHRMIGTTTKQK
jgi:FkbM family methyltransferase